MNVPEACDVLLIDDYPDHAGLVTMVLSRRYRDTVRVAETGLQGIEFAQQKRPDIILVRLRLMDMDGYQVCRRIKASPSLEQVPLLLFAAAKASDDLYSEAQRSGAAGYLYQPFHVDELCTARNTLLCGGTYYP